MHLKTLGILEHNMERKWKVDFDDDFTSEFSRFSDPVRQKIISLAEVLKVFGPQLAGSIVRTLNGSKHSNMKELRFNADNGVWRVAFAFDVKQAAILLVGGDKSGVSQDKFYRNLIEIADRRFDQHQLKLTNKRKKNDGLFRGDDRSGI
jgi:hypothetical protein